jgi:uncharacterized protein YjdB
VTIRRRSGRARRSIQGVVLAAAVACQSSTDSSSGSGPAPVAGVSVNPASTTLSVGATQPLIATLRDAAGNALTGRTVAWSSSDQSIASVSSLGVVAAIAPGNATITASSEGKSGTAVIAVLGTVTSVTVTLNYAGVVAGQTIDAQAVALDATRSAVANRPVTWSTSDTTVATVTADGFVSTLAVGTVSIVATVDGKSGTALVVVQAPPAADGNLHVEFSPVVLPAVAKAVNVILDGVAGTTAASIALGNVGRSFQRVPQSNRYVVTISGAELVGHCSVFTGSLPTCSIGNVTVTTNGAPQVVFGLVAQSPANTAPAPVTSLGPTAQRSVYAVNIRQDDLNATSVAQQFYQHLPDVFDYLILNNTAFTPNSSVFFVSARNRVTGLGISINDNSASFGASPTGKLRGLVNYTTNAPVDLAQQVATHEMGHAFCCFIKNTPLTSGSPHWPLSSAAFGIMGGNGNPGSNAGNMKLTPLGDGTYRVDAQAPYGGFTNLDMYLFGLADSSEVEPQFVFTNQNQTVTVGAILTGPTTPTTIRDIVAANGLRPLEYTGTPISYRATLVVVSRGRLLTPQEMAYYDLAAQRGEATISFDGKFLTPFFVNTRGRGVLVTKLP